ARTRARGSASSTASSSPRTARVSACMSERRILIEAEGYSTNNRSGKTMRGCLRYRRDDVVGILDSEHAGETRDGLPVVGHVDDAVALRPTVALVGVATQGGRFPPAWRALLSDCIRA